MANLRKFIKSNTGHQGNVILILVVLVGIFIYFLNNLPNTYSISVVLRNGKVLSGNYSGGGSLYGITIIDDNGKKEFYPYEIVNSYCLYNTNMETECEKIDHTPIRPWPGAV